MAGAWQLSSVLAVLALCLGSCGALQPVPWQQLGHDASHTSNSHLAMPVRAMLAWSVSTGSSLIETSVVVSPADLVYVASSSGVAYCLRADTGDQVWQYDTKSPIFGTPALSPDAEYLYLATKSGFMCVS